MRITLLSIIAFFSISNLAAQDDLMSLLEEDSTEQQTDYASALFKTTRVINLQSLENNAPGELDFKISHRFGFINQGAYEFFGLDNATIRLGLEMGLTDHLMVGFGRSSYEKSYDAFLKYKLLRQSSGDRNMPIGVSAFSSIAVNSLRNDDPDVEVPFSTRLSYAFQLIIGRKFSEGFTFQVSPSLVHRNLVETTNESNDVFAIGFAARQKIGKRFSINAEYVYSLPDQLGEEFTNSFSIGVDLETGGHVFQLHFTNSTAMIEKGFIAETVGDWLDGDIHFGFNISRVFTLWESKPKMDQKKRRKDE